MSCLVRYDDIALPVAFEAIRKNIRYSDVKNKKRKDKLPSIKMNFSFYVGAGGKKWSVV